jgi:hypothetical protein
MQWLRLWAEKYRDDGLGTADQPRLYQLIRQPGPIAARQIEIEFLDPGTQIFALTFG